MINIAIIKQDKSIIPSLDVNTLEKAKQIVEETHDIKGIGAYKVGFELCIPFGLKAVVETIRKITDKPIIYDHQKAGTDIPDTGIKFMQVCKATGVDAVIIFPQAGIQTEIDWIKAAKQVGMPLIVGGEMTHPGYLEKDGGFLMNDAPKKMYEIAAKNGIVDFVVPGNKPERIKYYKDILESIAINPVFYSPGLVSQGGKISDSGKAAGKRWHAIVGRAIFNAEDIKKEAGEMCREIIK